MNTFARVQVCLLQYPLRPPWRPYDRDYSRPVCSVRLIDTGALSVRASPPLWAALYRMSCMQVQLSPGKSGCKWRFPSTRLQQSTMQMRNPSAHLETIRLDSTVVDMRTTACCAHHQASLLASSS